MAIKKEEDKKKNGMKITDNMDGEKKANEKLLFEAEENPDILETIAKSNIRPKIVIGFSA